jgi:SAM-dependent methyltransferase
MSCQKHNTLLYDRVNLEKYLLIVKRALAVNPRGGELLRSLTDCGAAIDSFVSDEEWVRAAHGFSLNVYHGRSHRPLLQAPNDSYDLVLVCEDFALVDDADRMAQQYFRVLQPGGVLLCRLWNMSYALNINSFLIGKGSVESVNCGIPLDCLTMRLDEIGFQSLELFPDLDANADTAAVSELSGRRPEPLPNERFAAKSYIIRATKEII